LATSGESYTGDDGSHEDRTIRLWDVAKRAEHRRFTRSQPYSGRLRFTPDSRSFVYNDGGALHFVDIGTGQELTPSSFKEVADFTFAAGGRWLVLLGNDHTVRFWELASGMELYRIAPPDCGMSRIETVPGDRTLLTLNEDATVVIWDLTPLGYAIAANAAREAPKLWTDLASADGPTAYRAVWALASDCKRAVAVLRERLPGSLQAVAGRAKRLHALIADLESEDFDRREAASLELSAALAEARPALRTALRGSPSAESRKRLEKLLAQAAYLRSGEELRCLRVVTTLERIGTAEAVKLLETIAEGPEEAWPAQEAKASLERLARRQGDVPD
jgi:hypothetical protein